MADPIASPEELDLLAAELVLGVLEGADRVRALRLQLADRDFRDAVMAWQTRLAPLFDAIPEAPVDPALWSRVEAFLPDLRKSRFAARLRAWRLGAIGAGALAAALAMVLIVQPASTPAPDARTATSIAQLTGKSGESLLVAQYDPRVGRLRVRTANVPTSALEPELWVIPVGGAPHSLGRIPKTGSSELTLDPATRALLRSGSVLAMTLEPADGKRHGAPSGAILGAAPLSEL
jgi:anti-sigma-K factor RskA